MRVAGGSRGGGGGSVGDKQKIEGKRKENEVLLVVVVGRSLECDLHPDAPRSSFGNYSTAPWWRKGATAFPQLE